MNSEFYNAAANYLKAGQIFKTITGYGPGKAEEVLVSSFVNVWLELQGDSRRLQINSKQHGVDCYVIDHGIKIPPRNEVEIKTLQGGRAFQFGRHFLPSGFIHKTSKTTLNPAECGFNDHLMVVCAILKDSAIKTIYIAHGPDVMTEFATQLGNDTERPTFIVQRPRKADNPLLYASHSSIRAAALSSKMKKYPLKYPLGYTLPKGLDDLTVIYPFNNTNQNNWVVKLECNDLNRQEMQVKNSNHLNGGDISGQGDFANDDYLSEYDKVIKEMIKFENQSFPA